ncbi:hypothetical protein BpHYR1_028060 [Brachionus plicatilis]|uniref:Uncharacterized protein n=1 Tax=Brachionus plicatilis TaxID=10195 RepID=A0A3M7SPJ4_BRAPC|nr:hypothetical protein BpHYR1_028060 [Brachionus plicatilis]
MSRIIKNGWNNLIEFCLFFSTEAIFKIQLLDLPLSHKENKVIFQLLKLTRKFQNTDMNKATSSQQKINSKKLNSTLIPGAQINLGTNFSLLLCNLQDDVRRKVAVYLILPHADLMERKTHSEINYDQIIAAEREKMRERERERERREKISRNN